MISIDFQIPVLLIGTLIAQGVFAAAILWFSKKNKQANRFLSLLLLTFSLWLVDAFYIASGIYQQDPNFYFQPIYYSFAFGPLIYFYVRSLTNDSFLFRWKDTLHFIPVLIQAALYWTLTFIDYESRRRFWLEVHRPYTDGIEFDGTLLSLFIYLIFSVRLLFKYQSWLKEHFSEFSKIYLNWLKTILSAMLILCLFWSVDVIFRDVFHTYRAHSFSEICMGFAVIILAFGGIRQGSIDEINFIPLSAKADQEKVNPLFIDQITTQMQAQKLYLFPTLSLQEFSKKIDLPARTISNHLNKGLNISFVDFVNQYRVEEIKQRIDQGDLDQFTLLSIAYDSGFNSKSTFNRVFRKITGINPSQYLNKGQNTK